MKGVGVWFVFLNNYFQFLKGGVWFVFLNNYF